MQSAPGEQPALELLVHGVGGTTPAEMLDDPHTVRVAGDDTAALYRRAKDAPPREEDAPPGEHAPPRADAAPHDDAPPREDASRAPRPEADAPVQEAYVWCNLTSGDASRALWLLLLPFMVVNLAHWMRPRALRRPRLVRLYGALVRLLGLSLTVLLVAAACEVALDLTAWQCAGTAACAEGRAWLGFLSPHTSPGDWWTQPGRRLALAALVPAALVLLLWFLAHKTWSAYENQRPLPASTDDTGSAPDAGATATAPAHEAKVPRDTPALARPGFWYGRRIVARLRAAHTAAALLTVAAGVGTAVTAQDAAHDGPVLAGRLLCGLCAVLGVLVLAAVCRRGRSERRLDLTFDRLTVRALPLASLALLLATLGYALADRPADRSTGTLPGDALFRVLTLTQGLLVLALAAVAALLHRSAPDSRTALRGYGGPATALLACALGGVLTGGLAQRVADWLDGPATPGEGTSPLPGPPVLLSWQAAVLPPMLLLLLLLAARLGIATWRRARAGAGRVEADYPGVRHDEARTRAIALTRAAAALTDRAPALLGLGAAGTLLLGAVALVGAWTSGEVPGEATTGLPAAVHGLAQTCQALGSWLTGLAALLFLAFGRRAYRDPHARRTIGILWDVGTFWPRAAHPFAPPCYAERAVPDLTWRMATWTARTGGRLVLSGHSQGSVLAAAAAWQLPPQVRGRIALLTYGSPLERLYGRWFPAHFGPTALTGLHTDVDRWTNLYRATDPIGGPVRVPGVDHTPLRDPLAYGRTPDEPLPPPIHGHGDYPCDPAFAKARAALLHRLRPTGPVPRQPDRASTAPEEAESTGGAADA
ncbi:hypothetical protein [Streptomyces sp. AM 3-1-1]|uniref:hypothetical protein n=1 Tax=Streptomyces sp. AM 3-1-1 TaxID=3028711 RepID=UPI0023BA0973|nr:hypothetical protein [Streptomyces sp. AM 3-1-1]WEH31377.1 hypothetical protein P0D76_30775 [Streptomyces sp. AM 3-1-1]